LPLRYSGMPAAQRRKLALQALALVGLSSRIHHRPTQLSGGQQQRVAIARALITAPAVILADEPTGNLDSRTSAQIMTILQRLNGLGMTIVIVTHEADIANYCRRKVMFLDGRIISDTINPAPTVVPAGAIITPVATLQPLLPQSTS
jgi:putative ABC transport system ATP-binding protein